MKKVVLTALNAKYFHTNLAVRCLKGYVGESHDIDIVERTINDNMDSVLESIISLRPDAVGFSCYIWNIEKIIHLSSNLKKVIPNCFIFLGGPEVSHDSKEIMQSNIHIDMIIKGEGELTFSEWIRAYENNEELNGIHGTTIRSGQDVLDNLGRIEKVNLDELPFLYDDLSEYENKMIYFETSRGCIMNCSYCMSGLAGDMTYMDVGKVQRAFSYFLKNNVRQVKLVDRTFNHPISRAKDIISMLIEQKKLYPQAITNFHLEITASILDEELINILKRAPDGLIQFEAGVQSTNPKTLKAVSRNLDSRKLLENIKKIADIDSITVYADLIAGLPYESYKSFKNSFNDVYILNTEKIHLGFLKVLKGSDIKAKAKSYGIKYSDVAPYKVLKTNDITYGELRNLEKIEHLVDLYKNSENFSSSIEFIIEEFDNPFDFYEKFMIYLEGLNFFGSNQKIVKQYDILYEFVTSNIEINNEVLKDKLLLDWAMMEKPRRYPKAIEPQNSNEQRQFVRDFYANSENIEKYLSGYKDLSPQVISRMCHIAFFDGGKKALLYDYKKPKRTRKHYITSKN